MLKLIGVVMILAFVWLRIFSKNQPPNILEERGRPFQEVQ